MNHTISHLKKQVERINRIFSSDAYVLAKSKKGYCLRKKVNVDTTDVFGCGYVSSRELSARIESFILGIFHA